MQNEDYIYNGERVVRVNKKVARKMYDAGKQVWLIQDMMRLVNAWQSPCPISKKDNGGDREFDALVNGYPLTRLVYTFLKMGYDARPMNFGGGELNLSGTPIGISLTVGTHTCA